MLSQAYYEPYIDNSIDYLVIEEFEESSIDLDEPQLAYLRTDSNTCISYCVNFSADWSN